MRKLLWILLLGGLAGVASAQVPVPRRATPAEVTAGTDNNAYITPQAAALAGLSSPTGGLTFTVSSNLVLSIMETGHVASATAVSTVSPWTMVVIPDTQYLSQMTNGGAEALTAISNFLVLNKDALNIKVVSGEGDIVDDASQAAQWQAMTNFYNGLQTTLEVPVVLPMGNHDINSLGSRNNTTYNSHFPTNWFTQGAWTFKDYGASENAYLLQTNNGVPWIFISLEWAPRTNSLDWVTNVLTTFSNHNAAIITHMFLDSDRTLERADSAANQTTGYTDSNNATNMWQRWFRYHPNVRMILNGHVYNAPAIANVARYGVWGNKVHMMCFNHQNASPNQTNVAFVRIVQFDEKNHTARIRTYNPYTGQFHTAAGAYGSSQFSMNFDDANFPEVVLDDFRIESLSDAHLSLKTPAHQWSFRTSDFVAPWGTAGALELRAGSNDSVYSNSLALRIEVDGKTQMRGDIISPVTDQVLYFPLDEGFGNQAFDKVRGTRAYNPWPWGSTNAWMDGAVGGAFITGQQIGSGLDASVLTITNDAATYGALTRISISAWFKLGSINTAGVIVSKTAGGTDGSWVLSVASTTSLLWTTIVNTSDRDDHTVTVPDLTDRLWHHVVATFDGTTKNVYLDGVLVGTKTPTAGPLRTLTHNVMIGEYTGDGGGINYALNGAVDEFRIFSRAITPAEVLTLYRVAKNPGRIVPAGGTLYYSGGPSYWPTRPYFPGAFYIGYSNGYGYRLWSTNGGGGVSTSWTYTNLFGPN